MPSYWSPTTFEQLAGQHRIQRVPTTEKNGRRHTSSVVVVALPNGKPTVNVEINPNDVREDTYRGSGAGGQHRNKTDSCVRLTHLPTGTVVTAEDHRSQHQNRQQAWARLAERVNGAARSKAADAANAHRSSQFDTSRCWVWCGWRDEVTSADGRRASMRRALKGDLGRLLR